MEMYTESSGIDTASDMNSSTDDYSSPDRTLLKPRTLVYDESYDPPPLQTRQRFTQTQINADEDDIDAIDGIQNNNVIKPSYRNGLTTSSTRSRMQVVESPPYRKVRALRLFDTPATPKTILQKSEIVSTNNNSSSKYLKSLSCHGDSFIGRKPIGISSTPKVHERPKSLPIHNKNLDITANINPFSPSSSLLQNKKRSRSEKVESPAMALFRMSTATNMSESFNSKSNSSITSLGEEVPFENLDDYRQAPKRLALQDSNIPRYEKEFLELSVIGEGEFGRAYKCINRLDGCVYAIKRSKNPVDAGSVLEKIALNEVYAHAVLEKHDNVVRYFSAWAENHHMMIQNEFCNGGSLQTLLQKRCLNEWELRTLLVHIADGLKYIHSSGLVHLDLKAGNIFLTRAPPKQFGETYKDEFDDNEDDMETIVTYKIGDLGHVTSIKDPQVEEGDCRYMPNEILQENYVHLPKADIFALGMTLYEAGGGGPLPKNGPEWQNLRNGRVPDLPNISRELNDLIKLMMHPNPALRPSSTSILDHELLCPSESKTMGQVYNELQIERKKYELMARKFKEAQRKIKSLEAGRTPLERRRAANDSPMRLRSANRAKRQTPLVLPNSRRPGIRG